jgi:hypothetical protein
VAHQIYKGCLSWIKSDSATNAEKRFKYEKQKRLERIFKAKWCEGRSWLKYNRDENVLRYKSSSVHSFHEKYSSRENKHFKSLPVN